ncbi:MAG: type II toxin-antitoxin system VapB family antitoxin [Caulobacteraceae bacterium]|nr:type II toxin-antitoxin system VapB family antitoxin [Caulobacteraceae bacterium]
MAFHIRDAETDTLVRELAQRRGVGLTEAVKIAVGAELKRDADDRNERRRRLDEIRKEVAAWPRTGLKADKAFFDDLSGD